MSDRSAGAPSRRAFLTLAVHIAAFRREPAAYCIALWWWLRGKRVRARACFAPLLGATPQAYRLWLLRQPVRPSSSDKDGCQITALVDAGGDGNLAKTLNSLAEEGIAALVVGKKGDAELAAVIPKIAWDAKPWLLPMKAGDLLASGAAAMYRELIRVKDCDVAYADDDLLDDAGRRHCPHFKPAWNAELFHHLDYLSGACVVRATRAQLEAASTAHDWIAAVIRYNARPGRVAQIHAILHHRRTRPSPAVRQVPQVLRCELPPLSVIIPTRDRADLLKNCLHGLATTDYHDLEVIVVDNDSRDPAALALLSSIESSRCRVVRHPGPFNFSAINNHGIREAGGTLICLLNNDIEMLNSAWLAIMATQALRSEVGAVGAQLLYPDGRIQHAGVVLGIGGGAAHAHRLLHPNEEGYLHRHTLPQFVSAVTAACLVVQKEKFLAVDGFDERHFAVAFNDVDLCLRLNARGWQTLYEPAATLVHHESVSRGFDRDLAGAARLQAELAALKGRWRTDQIVDPYHHPDLSPSSERFVIRL